MRTFFATALVLVSLLIATSARAEATPDMKQLSEQEMAGLTGGFTLPNGWNVNLGIENQIMLNGNPVANASFSINGTTVVNTATGVGQIQGNNGVTNIAALSAIGATIITNTANNVNLTQMRTVDVGITNANFNPQTVNNFAMLQAQVNAMRGLH